MSKTRVNYKSDLPPIEVDFKLNGATVGIPEHDFLLRFYIQDQAGDEIVGYRNGEYFGCRPNEAGTKLVCFIKNRRFFYVGRLCVEYIDLNPNTDYEDGIKKTVTPCKLDIVFVEGPGDESTGISASVAIDISGVLADMKEKLAELDEWDASLEELKTAVSNLQASVSNLQTNVGNMQINLGNLQSDVDALGNRIDSTQSNVSALLEWKSEANVTFNTITTNITDLGSRVHILEVDKANELDVSFLATSDSVTADTHTGVYNAIEGKYYLYTSEGVVVWRNVIAGGNVLQLTVFTGTVLRTYTMSRNGDTSNISHTDESLQLVIKTNNGEILDGSDENPLDNG